jgi:PAS domain S-box-containing protein
MKLIKSQNILINKHLKSLPLLPWDIIKELLWDIEDELFYEMDSLAVINKWHFNYFIDSFSHIKDYAIVITDKHKNIICVSNKFCDLTKYNQEELLLQDPIMLQGQHTDSRVKKIMKKAIGESMPFTAKLVNYHKDGTPYGCEMHIYPIFNEKKETTHYIAFEKEYFE